MEIYTKFHLWVFPECDICICKCYGNHHFKMHLTPNMYKIVTWKANVKKIVTIKCIWHQICTKCCYLKMHVAPKANEFEGKCKGNRYLKMHMTPNMYKIITLKANAKEIITLKCMWHKYVQNRYFEGKCSGNCYLKMHMAPNMCKIVTLKANAKEIVTCKMHMTLNTYKIVNLKVNAQEIITVKMHLTPNMYKIITLKANAQNIITSKMHVAPYMCKTHEFEGKC